MRRYEPIRLDSAFPHRWSLTPEQLLQVAFLERAIQDFILWHEGKRSSHRGEMGLAETGVCSADAYRTARAWLQSAAIGAWTFEGVCDSLQLDAAAVRNVIFRPKFRISRRTWVQWQRVFPISTCGRRKKRVRRAA